MLLSSAASIILGIFYFTSNDLKVAMIAVTAIIALYGILVGKFGKVTLHVREEYMENSSK